MTPEERITEALDTLSRISKDSANTAEDQAKACAMILAYATRDRLVFVDYDEDGEVEDDPTPPVAPYAA